MKHYRHPSAIRATTPLRICSWNLENFNADDPDKLNRMADAIVGPLGCPHILAAQEMHGPFATEENAAHVNPHAEALIAAIAARSGRHYRYAEVTPKQKSAEGDQNPAIRCGFFYRTDRVHLAEPLRTEMPGNGPAFVANGQDIRIHAHNPRTIAEGRSPLFPARAALGQFTDTQSGEQYFIVNAHLKSNPGLYASVPAQEAEKSLQLQRSQARHVRDFVKDLWGAHSPYATQLNSHVILCGDFNAPSPAPGSSNGTLDILQNTHLVCTTDELPHGSSHSIGENASNLDHAYVSYPLAAHTQTHRPTLNDGPNPLSDHNPTIMEIAPPTALRPAACMKR